MKMRSHRILTMIMLSLSISACSTMKKPEPITVNDPSLTRLNQIAEHAERSTHMLAQIQAEKAKSQITLQGARQADLAATATPIGWGKKTNVSFEGPFNKLIATLATRAGYQLFTQGVRPANIPLVTIDARAKSLKQILNNVVAQLPANIGIALYPQTRSLIINYQQGRG